MIRSTHPLWLLLAVGCVFPAAEDVAEGQADGLKGSWSYLSSNGLDFAWRTSATWEGGGCVEAELAPSSGGLKSWSLQVALDTEVDTITDSSNEGVSISLLSPSTMAVKPMDSALDSGEVTSFYYCSEAFGRPTSITAITTPASTSSSSSSGSSSSSSSGGSSSSGSSSGGSSSGGSSSGGSSSGGSSSGTGDGSSGGMSAGGWGLSWEETFDSKGGTCMEYSLVNLTGSDVSDWWAQIYLGRTASVTDGWGLASFTFDTNVLWVMPESWDTGGIDDRGTVTGTVCLDPFTAPIGFVVYGDESSSGSSSSTDPSLAGELFDRSAGWALRYSDGGSTSTEHCLNLMFANLSGDDATDWSGVLTFDSTVQVTRSWTVQAFGTGSADVTFFADNYIQALDHGDIAWGGICTRSAAEPIALQIDAEY